VLASFRGRGVGQAVKAASILTLLDAGITSFSTGGAAANARSIAANEALGYRLTERWRSYHQNDARGN
jgi:RimJ/RimL family protein N-acetyltransferase